MKLTFLNVLTLIFIVLKLTDVIGWSWLLVLSPTLIPLFIVFCAFILSCLFVFLKLMFSNEDKK